MYAEWCCGICSAFCSAQRLYSVSGTHMATLFREQNDTWQIQVMRPTGVPGVTKRAHVDEPTAREILRRVEQLVAAARWGLTPSPDLQVWVNRLPMPIRRRLAAAHLLPEHMALAVAPLRGLTIHELGKRWIDDLGGEVGPGTRINWQTALDAYQLFFKADSPAASVDLAGVHAFRKWARDEMQWSPATISKRHKLARQMWQHGLSIKAVLENPWTRVKSGTEKNPDRIHFVDHATIRRVLDGVADDPDAVWWRRLIVLARFAGCRIPSEVADLTGRDVDLAGGKLTIRGKKTKASGAYERVVPLFPELRAVLAPPPAAKGAGKTARGQGRTTGAKSRFTPGGKSASGAAVAALDPDAPLLGPLATKSGTVLFNGMQDRVKRAGLEPWPRLWQNLRASRSMELNAQYPARMVADWLGHSEAVAQEHYQRTRDPDFKRAAEGKSVI